jgi:hypothetical protein
MYICSLCDATKLSFKKYVRHLKLQHSSDKNFRVICNVDGCRNSFNRVRNLVRHVSRKHKVGSDIPEPDESDDALSVASNTDSIHSESGLNEHSDASVGATRVLTLDTLTKKIDELQLYFMRFMVMVKEKYLLPEAARADIADEVTFIFETLHEMYSTVFKSTCCTYSFDMSADLVCKYMFAPESPITRIFKDFSTDYNVAQYLKNRNILVESRKEFVTVGECTINFEYVPVPQVLTNVLSNREIIEHILQVSGSRRDDEWLRDYADGTAFKSHEFFTAHPDALRLHFYSDEFEVCNPIGAQRGKHKVLGIYYMIGNIDSRYRSQEKFIHLACLIRYQDLKLIKDCDRSCYLFFKPLIHDLQALATTGIVVSVDGKPFTFRAALATISGDNLSSHAMAGFQTHFHSGRICRLCMIDHADIAKCFTESSQTLRTVAVHKYHVDAVNASPTNISIYGVTHECVFNQLGYFEVTQSFPPDIMHDLLEGVIPQTVRRIIAAVVSLRRCSVADINKRLKMRYTGIDKKPIMLKDTMLKDSGSLTGSASQKWSLFLLLPQLLNDYVTSNDSFWQVYLMLLDVTDYVFAQSVRYSELYYVEGLITAFLNLYCETFGSNAVTPKFHFLVHYSRMIRVFGPLRHLWCMRFESKHQYFKKVIARLHNFINVTTTMAKRHQLLQTYELWGSDVLGASVHSIGKTTVLSVTSLPSLLQASLTERFNIEFVEIETFASSSKVMFDRVKVNVGHVFVFKCVEEEEVPAFILVKFIINIRGTWVMCGRLLISNEFISHYHAYKVTLGDGWVTMLPSQLHDHESHLMFEINNSTYVSIKYQSNARCIEMY